MVWSGPGAGTGMYNAQCTMYNAARRQEPRITNERRKCPLRVQEPRITNERRKCPLRVQEPRMINERRKCPLRVQEPRMINERRKCPLRVQEPRITKERRKCPLRVQEPRAVLILHVLPAGKRKDNSHQKAHKNRPRCPSGVHRGRFLSLFTDSAARPPRSDTPQSSPRADRESVPARPAHPPP